MKINILRFAATTLLIFQCLFATTQAQTAKSILDKAATTITAPQGMMANFKIKTTNGSTSGTIAIKGKKFHAQTPQATIWFDGKTQWTYMKSNDEINVSNPTETQLQAINPYNFIYLYKHNYTYTLNKVEKNYIIHLKTNNSKRKIKELFITIDKQNYQPKQVKMLQNKKWTTFDISGIKKQKIDDNYFRFNSKDFPQAEIIDLR